MAGTGYDFFYKSFNPEGKLYQTEYANKAVENGNSIVGIVCNDGVIIATEKLMPSKMMLPDKRVIALETNIGCTYSGYLSDGMALALRGQREAQNYSSQYGLQISSKFLVEQLSQYVHAHTMYIVTRCFGVGMLIAAVDEVEQNKIPSLYYFDAAGESYKYYAFAAGKGRQIARTELERLKPREISTQDAVFGLARLLHLTHEEPKKYTLEMGWIGPHTNYKFQRVPDEVVKAEEKRALEAIEKEQMG